MNAERRARHVGSRGEDGGKAVASVGCISTSSPPRKEAMRRLSVAFVVMTLAPGFGIPRLLAQQSPELARLQFFARILAQEGIAFDTASSAPGRGNIWARLKGGSNAALVLLHHMDVVPADPSHWDVDPFSATVKDNEIWGRGALDTKTLGIVELEAFLALHRDKTPLTRDVIFMATADEEAG